MIEDKKYQAKVRAINTLHEIITESYNQMDMYIRLATRIEGFKIYKLVLIKAIGIKYAVNLGIHSFNPLSEGHLKLFYTKYFANKYFNKLRKQYDLHETPGV